MNIGNNAFSFCINLESFIIPCLVKLIENYSFYNCEKLKSVIFSNEYHVESIGNNAFSFCYSLEFIEIPKTVYLIGDYAFHTCKN